MYSSNRMLHVFVSVTLFDVDLCCLDCLLVLHYCIFRTQTPSDLFVLTVTTYYSNLFSLEPYGHCLTVCVYSEMLLLLTHR